MEEIAKKSTATDKNDIEDARMNPDRAEGTSSSDASGNPSAIAFSEATYQPSIRKLIDRGFVDAESDGTIALLQRVSYRHLQPYLAAVEQADPKRPQLKTAYELLSLDREFQSIALKYIGIFETQLRAQYAHWMNALHGPYSIYDSSLFHKIDEHTNSLTILERELKRRRDPAVRKMYRQHDGHPPIWEAIEFATLGAVSKLYGNTATRSVTDHVAEFFGCSKSELGNWTKTITAVRNIAAHFEAYLVRTEIPSTPLKLRNVECSARLPFYVVLLLARLLGPPSIFANLNLAHARYLKDDLRKLIENSQAEIPRAVDIARFPKDWESLLSQACGDSLASHEDPTNEKEPDSSDEEHSEGAAK